MVVNSFGGESLRQDYGTVKKVVVTAEGKKIDQGLDQHDKYVWQPLVRLLSYEEERNIVLTFFSHLRYEFGGPVGVTAIMAGFPILMYYFWICLWFYDGQLVHPKSFDDIKPFLGTMWNHIREVRVFPLYLDLSNF